MASHTCYYHITDMCIGGHPGIVTSRYCHDLQDSVASSVVMHYAELFANQNKARQYGITVHPTYSREHLDCFVKTTSDQCVSFSIIVQRSHVLQMSLELSFHLSCANMEDIDMASCSSCKDVEAALVP